MSPWRETIRPRLNQRRTNRQQIAEPAGSLAEAFPLLRPIEVTDSKAVHRFSVTQLINYQRCPRQYYFDRILHLPSADQMAVWNDAEAPEPPANLTATLKGAVIHRFCETYVTGEAVEDALRRSFDDVIRSRQAELADRLVEINFDAGVAELLPLAQNYLSSGVFERIERRALVRIRPAVAGGQIGLPIGLLELRRPLERIEFQAATATGNSERRN